jgi:rhodanese-related sulfurtransferase
MTLRDLFRRAEAIDVAEVARRLDAGDLVLVDVRQHAEWRRGRAPRAQHVPLAAVGAHVPALARETRTVAFICRTGHRSAAACAAARGRGLEALNVRGGMGAWERAGLPVTRE